MGQDRQMQMVGGNGGNQFRQYDGQNVGNLNGYNDVQNVGNQVIQNAVQNPRIQNVGNQNGLIGVPGNANQNQNGNGNLVAARAESNATGHNDLDEIEEVDANCILMANLQQASTSGTQTDKAPVYDSDGSAEVHNYENCYNNKIFNMFTQEEQYTELLEPIPEPHQVPQNDNNVISEVSSVEQSGGTIEQHPANVEETRVLYDSLYNNLAIEVEKVNTVNRKLRETNAELTTELARYKNQEKCFEITGSEIRPPMLNKENYVSWSSRLLRYAKSRPNGKLIHNSIINGPYTDDELTEKELKQIEAGDQAIQTILLGLPEDIYAAVDSCETAQEIWLRVQQMMKALTLESRRRMPSCSTNGKGLIPIKRNRLSLTIINYMQQPMPNPKDIIDPTIAMNMTLALMAKAFKLIYSTSTNNNQMISSNLCNGQIAQPGMNMGQDRQIQMVGGNGKIQFRQYARQNIGNLNRYNAIQNVGN
nr:hypothetical protein [Tanacetum cinerariifolium]